MPISFEDALEWKPRPLESYTTDEKIAFFDIMYGHLTDCMSELQECCIDAEEEVDIGDDSAQYVWEVAMQRMLGENIFEIYNAFCTATNLSNQRERNGG